MVVRLMSYIGLLYEDIIKAQQLSSKDYLPPVFPFVFFNGHNTWTAPFSSTQLLSPAVPPALKSYFPSFQYRLLDVAHHTLTPAECNDSDNLIIPLIQLEQNVKSFAAASVCLEALIKQLESPAYDSLRHAFALYLSRSMNIDQHCPGIDLEQLDLGDIKMTLMERLQAHAERD